MGFFGSSGSGSTVTPKKPDDNHEHDWDKEKRPFYPQSMWKTWREDGWKPPATSSLTGKPDDDKQTNASRTLLGS